MWRLASALRLPLPAALAVHSPLRPAFPASSAGRSAMAPPDTAALQQTRCRALAFGVPRVLRVAGVTGQSSSHPRAPGLAPRNRVDSPTDCRPRPHMPLGLCALPGRCEPFFQTAGRLEVKATAPPHRVLPDWDGSRSDRSLLAGRDCSVLSGSTGRRGTSKADVSGTCWVSGPNRRLATASGSCSRAATAA